MLFGLHGISWTAELERLLSILFISKEDSGIVRCQQFRQTADIFWQIILIERRNYYNMKMGVEERISCVQQAIKRLLQPILLLSIISLAACKPITNFSGSYNHTTQFGEPWLAEGEPVKTGKACLFVAPQFGGTYRVEIFRVEGTPHICSVVGTGRISEQRLLVSVDGLDSQTSSTLYLTRDADGITIHDTSARPPYCGAKVSLNGLHFPVNERQAPSAYGSCATK